MLASLALTGGAVHAQERSLDSAVLEAERAAEEAERAAEEARAFAEALRAEVEPPGEDPSDEAEGDGDDSADRDGEEDEYGGDREVTNADLAEAVERAETAADQAARAARAADQARRDREPEFGDGGPFVGGAFVYAGEQFDTSIIVNSSTGWAGFIGYRFGEFVSAEVRYEGFEGFDLKAFNGTSVIDGFAMTVIAKVYPFSGRIQPFASLGLGGMRLSQKIVFNDGSRLRGDESDGVFRFGAGLDLWLNPQMAINFEYAYLGPFDQLADLEMTLISGGLSLHF